MRRPIESCEYPSTDAVSSRSRRESPRSSRGASRRRQFIQQPDPVVRVHLGEQGGDLGILQAAHELALQLRRQRLERLHGALLRQQPVDDGAVSRIQPFEYRHDLPDRHRRQGGGCCGEIAPRQTLFDQVEKVIGVDVLGGDLLRGHGVLLSGRPTASARSSARAVVGWTVV